MSAKNDKNELIKLMQNKDKDTIPNRIKFVKELLKNNQLKPIINLDDTDTDNFITKQTDDNESDVKSYDTRATLKKEVYDITDVITDIGGTLIYIKSGTTGHTFKGEERDNNGNILYEYAVKVVAYSIKDKYGGMHDARRPENAELMMLKLLSYFIINKKTPHLVLPIGTFDTSITHFTDLIKRGFVKENNHKYKEFVDRYDAGEFYDDVSILISEWANRGDLNDFIKNNYKKFTPIHWKVLFFQLISTLAVIQGKYPTFRHNDLKPNNILVSKIDKDVEGFKYSVGGDDYVVPNINYQIKIWDFDFACIPGIVDNKKVMISNQWSRGINIGPTQNRYYDIHYFFNTLMRDGFFPELMTESRVPQEVKDFVLSIVPKKYQSREYVSKNGRILHNIEYTTPAKILKENPYFDEFRIIPRTNNNIKSQTQIDRPISVNVTSNLRQTQTNTSNTNEIKINNLLKGGDVELKNRVSEINNNTSNNIKLAKNKSKSKNKSKNKSKSKSKKIQKIKDNSKDRSKNKSKSKSKGRKHSKLDNIDIDKLLLGLK